MRWFAAGIRALTCVVALLALGACVGPPVLERQVLGYDEVAKGLDEKLLLLNIGRIERGESVHFTTTSSIAATFDWTTSVGVGGQLEEAPGTSLLNLNWGASASENPTFSIIPVAGEDFTRRVVTPFNDSTFEFLVFQGGQINQVMRLMAGGIKVQTPDGRFVRFIENDPRRPDEYTEFRQIAAHLQWLNDNRKLFVRSLVFEDVLISDFTQVPRAEDINNGFAMGLRWRQRPDGTYQLTRLTGGRVVVTNYDPMALSDGQRFELNEKIKKNPDSFVYLDIRPGQPGGDFPIQGAIKLRSMLQILAFIARGIRLAPEFAVAPAAQTGDVAGNPTKTLGISVQDRAPSQDPPSVFFQDAFYRVDDTPWDRSSFALLAALFQTTVGDVENLGVPITIAK